MFKEHLLAREFHWDFFGISIFNFTVFAELVSQFAKKGSENFEAHVRVETRI